MKTILINGSPRKNWNTHKLLLETERGAKEMGAETELLHLFDLSFTDCKSCFACKLRGNKTGGTCVLRDDLKPVLEKIGGADVVVIGSPVYYGHLTSPVLSLITRTTFPLMHYELDPATGSPAKEQHYNKQCGLIVTMNADENYLRSGLLQDFEASAGTIRMGLGNCETLYSCDTCQFKDYSKYYATMWDERHKVEHRDRQFPVDLQNAYELGKRLCRKAAEQ